MGILPRRQEPAGEQLGHMGEEHEGDPDIHHRYERLPPRVDPFTTGPSTSTSQGPTTGWEAVMGCLDTMQSQFDHFQHQVTGLHELMASASLLSTLEVDDDEARGELGSSIGSVFLPLRTFSNTNKGNSEYPAVGAKDTARSGETEGARGDYDRFGSRERRDVGNGGSGECDFAGKKSLVRCSNKRKERADTDIDGGGPGEGDASGSSGFRVLKPANNAIEVKSLDCGYLMLKKAAGTGETHQCSESKTWKVLSYNIWFREDLEMRERMRALGNLIELHSPDVICFQEVTPSFYDIFQRSRWWKGYRCSILDETAFPGGYFCMQLCKLPVKSYSCKPFHNSIMGRELCIAEVEVQQDIAIVVATSHLESPCPSPPKWDQMFSKERVVQANEAVRFLEKNKNVIFCGDMNWDDKLDGPFPLRDGWVDAWTELRPGEVGWTYDTKSNKMLSGNRALQKRLDRFVCKLKDFKISKIEMIGKDEIPGLSYIKEKRVKGQVQELVLPVLPSDHYGLLLTICPRDSS
ncbi:hypothetical protein DH2020_017266 [Rehmannia glutinosa]|uniref:Endonuclease/exonuclease/phosphatase domain-containing protein n=1 Tax=Rehmannia glutinosa TaxID=99300 RepID=A0ABR0WS12_REHGL